MPIPRNGIRTCTSEIGAHRASDYTTRAGSPHASRNKHFRYSPTSSIVKHKHALRNTPTPICRIATATRHLRACAHAFFSVPLCMLASLSLSVCLMFGVFSPSSFTPASRRQDDGAGACSYNNLRSPTTLAGP